MQSPKLLSILISSILLSACGSDSDEPTLPPDNTEYDHQVSGILTDTGAVSGATICVDSNQDAVCGDDEPSTTSLQDGSYQIDWNSTTESPSYQLIAEWIAPVQNKNTAPLSLNKAAFNAPAWVQAQNDDANRRLMALGDHNTDDINQLTQIEIEKVDKMIAAQLPNAEIDALRTTLNLLLANIYNKDVSSLYSVSAEQASDEAFMTAHALHQHVAALIADQLPQILVNEEVLSASKASLLDLVNNSGLSVTEYLDQDPIEVRMLVSDALIALGYIESPIDERLMNSADWQLFQDNMLDDSISPHKLILGPSYLNSFFTLDYGTADLSLFGYVNDQTVFSMVFDDRGMAQETNECWNTGLNRWIDAQRTDQGYEPLPAIFSGNTLHTWYEGTNVAINIKVDKLATTSDQWAATLSASQALLKLDTLIWPHTVYRYSIEQTADVMCRNPQNTTSWELPTASVDDLTTADIARLFWADFYPDEVAIDEQNQRLTVSITPDTQETYQWALQTSPNGLPLIHIVQVELPPQLQANVLPSDYLVSDLQIAEVEIHSKMTVGEQDGYLQLSFDGASNSFSNTLYQHLLSISQTIPAK